MTFSQHPLGTWCPQKVQAKKSPAGAGRGGYEKYRLHGTPELNAAAHAFHVCNRIRIICFLVMLVSFKVKAPRPGGLVITWPKLSP
jgi:hypothetical protein